MTLPSTIAAILIIASAYSGIAYALSVYRLLQPPQFTLGSTERFMECNTTLFQQGMCAIISLGFAGLILK